MIGLAVTPDLTWSKDRVARLGKLWRDGASASAIAREFSLTRNAVLGKVHRLGLLRTARAPIGVARAEPIATKRGPVREKASARKPKPKVSTDDLDDISPQQDEPEQDAFVPVDEDLPVTAGPADQGVSLGALRGGQCRWPIRGAGADMIYCGAAKQDYAKAYCGVHAKLAYQPPATRRTRAVA